MSAARTPALWRLAGQGSVGEPGGLRGAAADLPGRRLAHAERRAPGPSPTTPTPPAAPSPRSSPPAPAPPSPACPPSRPTTTSSTTTPTGACCRQQTPGCATAVGPGAALALADRAGHVASYLPGPDQVTAAVLARCPLTVVDLGTLGYAERARQLAAADAQLARIAAALPADTTLLVTAPGAPSKPPHLQLALADGPGYSAGLLNAASTRQPGLVVLTDLTPTVLGWLGRDRSAADRRRAHHPRRPGSLAATVQSLTGRDTAEQVWRDTHGEFFWAYALVDAVVLAAIGLALLGRGRGQAAAPGPRVAGGRGVRRRGARSAPSWPTWCPGPRPRTRPPGCTRSRSRWPWSSRWPRCSASVTAIRSGRSARSACSPWSCWGST